MAGLKRRSKKPVPESVAEWGEEWLRQWCAEPGLQDHEREDRAHQAAYWRDCTLETVMSADGWYHPLMRFALEDERERFMIEEGRVYRITKHALPVWRAFAHFRHEGLPVPEAVLRKFDEWAGRLLRLKNDAEHYDAIDAESRAILQALEFVGDGRKHKSVGRLVGVERRRRRATEIAALRSVNAPWERIAEHVGLSVQAAKELLYEFAPGPRRRERRASAEGKAATADALADAHRRMVGKR